MILVGNIGGSKTRLEQYESKDHKLGRQEVVSVAIN